MEGEKIEGGNTERGDTRKEGERYFFVKERDTRVPQSTLIEWQDLFSGGKVIKMEKR